MHTQWKQGDVGRMRDKPYVAATFTTGSIVQYVHAVGPSTDNNAVWRLLVGDVTEMADEWQWAPGRWIESTDAIEKLDETAGFMLWR